MELQFTNCRRHRRRFSKLLFAFHREMSNNSVFMIVNDFYIRERHWPETFRNKSRQKRHQSATTTTTAVVIYYFSI